MLSHQPQWLDLHCPLTTVKPHDSVMRCMNQTTEYFANENKGSQEGKDHPVIENAEADQSYCKISWETNFSRKFM